MSEISDKKAACGYTQKVIPSTCGNCAHFASDRTLPEWMEVLNSRRVRAYYTVEKDGIEKNLRCTKHGFTVKKMARCGDWEAKAEKVSA